MKSMIEVHGFLWLNIVIERCNPSPLTGDRTRSPPPHNTLLVNSALSVREMHSFLFPNVSWIVMIAIPLNQAISKITHIIV